MKTLQIERLARMRSLLSEAPSPPVWQQLCALFDENTEQDEERLLLDLLLNHLESWPRSLRNTPRHWLERWIQQGPDSLIRLVRMLSLERSSVGEVTASALRSLLDFCDPLHGLQLNGQALGADSAVILTTHRACEALHVLGLGGTLYDDRTMETLTRRGCLAQLKVLQLNDSLLTDQALFLMTSKASYRLQQLYLDNCLLTDKGVEALTTAEGMRELRCLTLSGNSLTWRTLQHLRESPYVTGLRVLDLSGLSFSSLDAELLTQSLNATHLTTLRVVECGEGVEALREWAAERNISLIADETPPALRATPSSAQRA